MRLRDRVAETIRDQGLWVPGARVVIAVSGGLDSVCLLDVLCRTQGRHGGRLEVATVDHGTRSESAADADFVESLAASRGLLCHRFDLALGADASEAECREARYRCIETVSAEHVALAHHQDDQAETVLLAMMRGSGSRGLAAMGWRRGRYVRPLLACSRSDLEAYAEKFRLTWREDPTNRDEAFERNALRARVMPLLETIRPGVVSALARSARIAAEESDVLDEAAQRLLPGTEWPLERAQNVPSVLFRRRILQIFDGARSGHLDDIERHLRTGNGEVRLSGLGEVHIGAGTVSARVALPNG